MTFQARLTTKLDKFSVNDAVVELKSSVERNELDVVVKTFLRDLGSHDEGELEKLRPFDFLVGGRLLRVSIEEHLKLYSDEIDANEVLSEKLVEVEYILSLEPPEPLEAIQHDDWVSCVDAHGPFIISGSYDNSVRIFVMQKRSIRKIVTIQKAHEKPVTKVKFLKQSKDKENDLYFVSCGHDEVSILRKFNTKTHKVEIVSVYRGHNRSVNCVDTCDDLFATGSFDKTLRIWSTNDEENVQNESMRENDPDVGDKRRNGSKKQKTKTSEKSIGKISRSAIMTLTGHQESVTGLKFLAGCNEYNSIASCSMDRSICIWDIEVGECKRRVYSSKPMLGIDFCAERNLIITASCDRFVRTWDARAPDNASAKTAYTSHTAWVSSVAFGLTSTNHFISGGYDNVVKLWDLRSSKACLYDMIGHHDKVLDVNWTNPACALSGSADSTLKIFLTG